MSMFRLPDNQEPAECRNVAIAPAEVIPICAADELHDYSADFFPRMLLVQSDRGRRRWRRGWCSTENDTPRRSGVLNAVELPLLDHRPGDVAHVVDPGQHHRWYRCHDYSILLNFITH